MRSIVVIAWILHLTSFTIAALASQPIAARNVASGRQSIKSPLFEGWLDDFETYTPNSFPSPNWTYSGNADIQVDSAIYHSGHQSVRLYGQVGGCWGALLHRRIDSSAACVMDYWTLAGSEQLYGCHPVNSNVMLHTGPSWTSNGRSLVSFDGDRVIRGATPNWTVLGDYSPGIWVHVRLQYRILSTDSIEMSYWLNGAFVLTEKLPALSFENQLHYLSPQAGEGTCWFDDISVQLPCCYGTTGNVDGAGGVDLSDLSALVSYLTGGSFTPPCMDAANVNGAGGVDLSDLSSLVSYLTGGSFVLPNCP